MNVPVNQLPAPRWDLYRGSTRPEYSFQTAPAALPEPEDVEWADYAKSIMGGGASLVQATGWLAGVLGAEDIGASIETLGRDAVDFWHDSLSDPAKAELAKEVIRKNEQTGEYEWGDPSFSTIGLMGAQSLLGTASGMGVGAGLTKTLQVFANPFGRKVLERAAIAQARHPGLVTAGVTQAAKKLKLVDMVLGATGFGIGEGAVGGISAGASVYDNVMNMDHDKLMLNDRYRQIFDATDNTISELERHQYAADTVAKEASTAAGWQSGLTTALLGAPMGAYFGRIIGGARLSTTLPRAIATGASGEAAQEFAQSGVEQLITNIQTMPFDPQIESFDDVLNAAVSGMMAGALLGGVVGPAAVGGARAEVETEKRIKQSEAYQNLRKIGGPLQPAAKKAAEAGADTVAIEAIYNDAIGQRISISEALDNLAALEREQVTGEEPRAVKPPPPEIPAVEVGKAPEVTQPTPEETEAMLEQAAALPLEPETVDPLTLQVDAERFQFKAQAGAEGVTAALKGVTKFEPLKAGMALVWENQAGERFVVDGHQRVALAKRAIAAGQDPATVKMSAFVLREADGITAESARRIAALKNIAEGTGSPIDAAKVMRDMGEEADEAIANLPPTSALVKQGKGLANLDEEAFGKAVNEVIDPRYAAVVGEMIPEDGKLQNAAIEVLRQTEPANAVQARAIVDQVRTAGVEEAIIEDLFGEEVVAESLYAERAKVLDAALRAARRERATFATLTKREAAISEAGNVLVPEANLARMSEAQQALAVLSAQANQIGPISDALTEAARRVKAGEKPGPVGQAFLAQAIETIEGRGPAGAPAREAEPAAEVAPALYARAKLQNRPVPSAALAELERAVINPIQTGELSPETDPGANLLAQAVDIREGTISLPEDNKASMTAIADTLDRVVRNAREFRYREGFRARGIRRTSEFGPGRETYEQMTNGINALQNLRDAVRRSAQQAPASREIQEDMFGAPPAPEPAPVPAQETLFSRPGIPLGQIRLTREFEMEGTGEVVEVEQNAEVLLRQHDKRTNVVRELRACIRG